jgi:hypothetical protein
MSVEIDATDMRFVEKEVKRVHCFLKIAGKLMRSRRCAADVLANQKRNLADWL